MFRGMWVIKRERKEKNSEEWLPAGGSWGVTRKLTKDCWFL